MNVLSLCDGMSCGYMALEKAGVQIDRYFASEIKPEAIACSEHNFPDIVHIGDVKKITYEDGVLHTEKGDFEIKFDLVIFGSPCQSFSSAMKPDKRIGLEDAMRSGIFYDCNRVLKEVKPMYFLMENVSMDEESKGIISRMMGVEPIKINSSLVSAQLRPRLYWTNIPNVTVPEDRGVTLSDVLDYGYTEKEKSRCLLANDSHGYYVGANRCWPAIFHRVNNFGFCTIVYESEEQYKTCLEVSKKILNGRKPKAEYYREYDGPEFEGIRFFTKRERARLQTVPEKYVECLSEKDAANLLGDGWTVDVIAHLFKGLKDDEDIMEDWM